MVHDVFRHCVYHPKTTEFWEKLLVDSGCSLKDLDNLTLDLEIKLIDLLAELSATPSQKKRGKSDTT